MAFSRSFQNVKSDELSFRDDRRDQCRIGSLASDEKGNSCKEVSP